MDCLFEEDGVMTLGSLSRVLALLLLAAPIEAQMDHVATADYADRAGERLLAMLLDRVA